MPAASILSLWSASETGEGCRASRSTRPPGFRGVSLAWNCASPEEVDARMARAVVAGARDRCDKPQKVFWGGYTGYFADPDGHLWEVAHNPGFPLSEDGRLTLPD